jgi:alkylhydroperoxidase/carboxymuconolactone decarboxylase family protein YurZ
MTRHDLRHQGETMLRTLFGSTVQPAGLANLLTEAAYGGIWTRPALSLHDRLICSIAALGVGPRLKALRRHIGAGLDHGLTAEAIREILVQASLYSGFSAAEESLALAGEVFPNGESSSRPIRRRTHRWRNSTGAGRPSWRICMATGQRRGMRRRIIR